ncbi:hypothetical protein Bbelb_250030 [Branchiostoma belcheri]|nr:hypothetical protein Bbelb_250030 [Branchiostoma belcheri]
MQGQDNLLKSAGNYGLGATNDERARRQPIARLARPSVVPISTIPDSSTMETHNMWAGPPPVNYPTHGLCLSTDPEKQNAGSHSLHGDVWLSYSSPLNDFTHKHVGKSTTSYQLGRSCRKRDCKDCNVESF